MKFLLFSILIVLFTSCSIFHKKEANPESNIDVKSEIIKGRSRFLSVTTQATDSVEQVIEYSFYKNKQNQLKPHEDSINKRIIDFVSTNTEFDHSTIKPEELDSKFFYHQLVKFDSLSHVDFVESEDERWWQIETSIGIQEFEQYSDLTINSWSYTGGAHGNAYLGYYLIDNSTGKLLKLEDFISDVPAFTIIAEQYFRSDNGLAPEDDLTEMGFWFTDGIFTCNNNFIFRDGKMQFLYNQYEIAPYAAGQITIEIPIEEIQNLLKIKL